MATFGPFKAIFAVVAIGAATIALLPQQGRVNASDANVETVSAPIAPKTVPKAAPAKLNVGLRPAETPSASLQASLGSTGSVPPSQSPEPTTTEQALPQPTTAKRTSTSVSANVRAAADSHAPIVGVLPAGQSVQILASEGGWTKVLLPSGKTGWVYSQFFSSAAKAPPAKRVSATSAPKAKEVRRTTTAPTSGQRARLGSTFVSRSGPSMMSQSTGIFPKGSAVQIVETRGSWLRVVLPDGSTGWIRRG